MFLAKRSKMMPEKTLEQFLQDKIVAHGAMDVGAFMSHALCHPDFGYYQMRDPFGEKGDFTTAPEVSQMFGEMIGAWVADVWVQMGMPKHFNLVECGPGRGTLMADILRAVKGVNGFLGAANIYLIENSAALKEKQKEALRNFSPQWCETLNEVDKDHPCIIVGNEFLDALPVEQLIRTDKGWQQRVVAYLDGSFNFDWKAAPKSLIECLPPNTQSNEIYEVSPARTAFIKVCAEHLKRQNGAALFIDYGHARRHHGDTLQAVKEHGFVSPLEDVGKCDITAHVDFEALSDTLKEMGGRVLPLVSQRHFLRSLGIEHRAKALYSIALGQGVRMDVDADLNRIIGREHMGELFKVLGFFNGFDYKPAGF